jgi:hypothetical protein
MPRTTPLAREEVGDLEDVFARVEKALGGLSVRHGAYGG